MGEGFGESDVPLVIKGRGEWDWAYGRKEDRECLLHGDAELLVVGKLARVD